jgi:uncharacterized protein (TIGR00162 family)
MVTGLPGIGYVAKLAVDYLIKKLKAELFEDIFCSSFPPYVIIRKDGTVELLKNEFYYWKNKRSPNDLLIFTGNVQATTPEGQYEIADEVLNVAEKYKVEKIFSLAAYVTSKSVNEPKVYVSATEIELIKEFKKFKITPMEAGSIYGTNGLLFGLAKLRNIKSLCLLSETPGYSTSTGHVPADAKSARALLDVLKNILGIKIDMKPLEEQAKITEELFQKIEKMEQEALDSMQKAASPPKDIYV